MVPRCYMLLCLAGVHGLHRYGHLYNSCSLSFLFSSVLQIECKWVKIDVNTVLIREAE